MESLLTYCATPSRLSHKTQEIFDFVLNQGHAPLHPFIALPQEVYGDAGPFGRNLKFALKLVEASEQFYLFGVSDGTLAETVRAKEKGIPVTLHIAHFDPEWRKYYEELGSKYNYPLGILLRR